MTALRKILVEEEPVVAVNAVRATAAKLYVVTNNAPADTRVAAPEAPEAAGNALVNVLLFFAAPFIGLAYIIALPFCGFAMLAYLVCGEALKYSAVRTAATVLRHALMIVAAPFIGLAYIVLFPFVGLGLLAWLAVKTAIAKA